jgi:hypothetical protein
LPADSKHIEGKHMNREEWLIRVAEQMAPWADDQGYPLPRYRIAIGFPSTGKRIGECWDGSASADGRFEGLIRPDRSDEIQVATILAHELVHATVGLECGHKGAFRTVATQIGLEGKMTATTPGETFKRDVAPILAAVGPSLTQRSALALRARRRSKGPLEGRMWRVRLYGARHARVGGRGAPPARSMAACKLTASTSPRTPTPRALRTPPNGRYSEPAVVRYI